MLAASRRARRLAVPLASFAVLAASGSRPARAGNEAAGHVPAESPHRYAIHIAQATTVSTLHRLLDGARERLRDPICQQVLDDFRDVEGRPLRRRLEVTGQTPDEYLGLVIFYDGRTHPRCSQEGIFAATSVGSRAVFVCPGELDRVAGLNAALAEATLIHEALHTLGLGENPPTSREITAGVLRRCRH
jgi:hypothetical protein